jgi:hypothetical protein
VPKRRIRGDRAFKRLIGKLPETVKGEMVVELNVLGRDQLARERSLVAKRSGKLGNALSFKVLPATLKLKVGLLGKPINKKLFYGRIIEFGRKSKVVDVVRGGLSSRVRAAGGRSNRYKALAHPDGRQGRVQAQGAGHGAAPLCVHHDARPAGGAVPQHLAARARSRRCRGKR